MLDGPINGDLFTAWVRQSLVPSLKPRDVVVLDNFGSHKSRRALAAVRDAGGHLLFLPPPLATPLSYAQRGPWPAPPYSPDLNPIEMMFVKLKTLFRKADRRTVEEAWREVGSLFDRFSSNECAAYFRHAGYGAVTA